MYFIFLGNKQIQWIYIPCWSGSGLISLFKVYFEFHKMLFTDYLVMANLWISNQIKGNKLCTTDTLWELRSHDIPFIVC